MVFGPHTHVFTPYSLLHPTAPDGWTVWGEMVDQELLAHKILHVDVTDNMVGVFRSLPTVIEMFSVPLEEIALFVFDTGQDDGSASLTPEEVTAELLHPSPGTAAALNRYIYGVAFAVEPEPYARLNMIIPVHLMGLAISVTASTCSYIRCRRAPEM